MIFKERFIKLWFLLSLIVLAFVISEQAGAQPLTFPRLTLGIESSTEPGDLVPTLQIILMLTLLSLAPSFLIMMTSFTRLIIIFSFIRSALSTPQTPPNQVLIGLALFLTIFIMAPTFQEINSVALQPMLNGEKTTEDALYDASGSLRNFMLKYTRMKDLKLFVELAKVDEPYDEEDVPLHVLIPAFIISELKTAFEIAFIIFVPFVMIDMIVASTLMAMGMLMLPPVMISLPFKILLFVLVDGWHLVIESVLMTY